MGVDYTLLAGIIAYTLIFRMLVTEKINALRAAGILIGGYFILITVIQGIFLASYGVLSIGQLFSIDRLAVVLAQFLVTWLVFSKIERSDKSEVDQIIFGGIGCLVVFFAIPMVIGVMLR